MAMVFDAGGLWRQELLRKLNEERLADAVRRPAHQPVPAGRIALRWCAAVAWLNKPLAPHAHKRKGDEGGERQAGAVLQ
jgi:hypothetical protein